jgi:dipeptidyl aminopeptidase/acylaminoacyl peptidase
MANVQVAAYGSWKSPITSDLIASGTVGLGQIALDGKYIYWIELRPQEGGRNVIVRNAPEGHTADLLPLPFNARTRVHEYGGGDFAVVDGRIYFSNFIDQRIYQLKPGNPPHPVTPEGNWRYADGVFDLRHGRMICVREDHAVAGREAINTLVSLRLEDGDRGDVLVSGSDFYSSPRLSPDGSQLAWLAWNHPNMPWDGTELWTGNLEGDCSLGKIGRVAGGIGESIFQPEWSPDGVLHFISDRTGWWNLYRWRDGSIEPLCEMEAEFGKPQWVLGMSTYAFESPGRIICTFTQKGRWQLASLDAATGQLEFIGSPYAEISNLHAAPGFVVFQGGSPTEPVSVIRLDLAQQRFEVLRRSSNATIDAGFLSVPEAIEFPTEHGLTAFAFFYPPRNRDHVAPPGERPPLLVESHGGPTGATTSTLSWGVQYWTSRGIAVLDVNYGGSTGQGRAYRQRLNGRWGIVDVDDCVNGARHIVEQGGADGNRLAIHGGSAGGYTTLCALTFRNAFKAGASYYGVSDLEALAKDTHKFESRYLDRLIGPYPERRDLYIERSPIHFTSPLSCPMILFQGLEDKVVPPNQAESMVEALRAKGLPVAYVPFAGEQHGFRLAEDIKRALEAELYFYSRVFHFKLSEPIEPVQIENMHTSP